MIIESKAIQTEVKELPFNIEDSVQSIPDIQPAKSNALFLDNKDDYQLNQVVDMMSSKKLKDFKIDTNFECETVHEHNLQDEINKILSDKLASTTPIDFDQLNADNAAENFIDILIEGSFNIDNSN